MIKLSRNASRHWVIKNLILLFMILMLISVSVCAITDNELDNSIKNGISWLTDQQNKSDGSWGDDYPVGTTGLAVVTLLDRPKYLDAKLNNASIKGLNYIFSKAHKYTKNGEEMIYFVSDKPNGYHTVYETSIAMMAIAASGLQNNIVNIPNSQINGMRFQEVVNLSLNYLRSEQDNKGGWGYGHLQPGLDNSNTGFAVLGLAYANDKFSIPIPPEIKTKLKMWINSLQCPDSGGAGYNAPCVTNTPYLSILETGNLLYEMAFVGDDTRAKKAINYIEGNWNNSSWSPGWKGPSSSGEKWSNYQATYIAMKGFKGLNIDTINVAGNNVNWYNEMASNIVKEQNFNGSWNDTWFVPRIIGTEFALLTLEKNVSIPSNPPPIGEKEEFHYSGTGNGDTNYGQIYKNYNVEVSKDIVAPEPGDPGCQNVVICVKTPKIDFKPVTVFALDSSGSMEQNSYAAPMLAGIGNALASHPNIEYARVDWDALLGTRSIDPVTGISPDPRSSDIDYSGKFRLANTWPSEISILQSTWGKPLFSEEPEGTDYYIGLKEALDKIKARKALATHPFIRQTTAWQIVFVSGKSEFSRGDINSLIKDALANGINISTIGIDIGNKDPTTNEEAQALQDMVTGTKGDATDLNLNVNPNAIEIEGKTNNILKNHVAKLYSTPVIKNVIVTETLYKYLRVLGSSPMYYDRKDNPDGTTTLYFRLPDLLQDNQSCITIYTELNFDKLPVDVSSNKNKPELDFRAAETTPASVVSYETDMALERIGKIPLPEGELSIRCGTPCPPTTPSPVVAANVTTPPETKEPANKTSTKIPGFDAALAAVGIIAAAYLLRR